MTLDRRMRQAAESVRRYADAEVDPVAMLWRQRRQQCRRSLQAAGGAPGLGGGGGGAGGRGGPGAAPPPRPLGRVAATIALPQAPFPRVVGPSTARSPSDGSTPNWAPSASG